LYLMIYVAAGSAPAVAAPTDPADAWLYFDNYRVQQGPVTKAALRILYEQAAIAKQTLVWKAGNSPTPAQLLVSPAFLMTSHTHVLQALQNGASWRRWRSCLRYTLRSARRAPWLALPLRMAELLLLLLVLLQERWMLMRLLAQVEHVEFGYTSICQSVNASFDFTVCCLQMMALPGHPCRCRPRKRPSGNALRSESVRRRRRSINGKVGC